MAMLTLGLSPPEYPPVPEKRSNPLENPSVGLNEVANWGWLLDGDQTDAGELINPETALKISTVFTCIKVLSESVASLPVELLRVTPQGKVQELENPLAFLLGVQPNPEMTSFVYFETVTFHLMLTGNSYSQIQRAEDGTPLALWPLNPRLTRPVRMPNGDLAFETSDGETGANKRIVAAKDIIHVPLMSHDGIVGLSPIMQAKRSLGLAAAAARFGSRLFQNNAMPQVVLKTTQKVKAEDKQKMRADWETLQSGVNQHRVAILDQELSAEKLSISPEEAQFLETRIHERSEIAAIYRVPLHMVGSDTKLSNSSVEGLNLLFIVDTLRPILSRIEAELVRKLVPGTPGQATVLTIRFDLAERQRGDTAAQVAMIAAGRNWGVLTANDGRRILGLPALDAEEENVTMVPVNMQNSKRLLNLTAPVPEQVVNNAA